ncbi:hypothetical protein HK102_011245, partial [Quaeritorhiza haematococci]
FKFKKLPKEGTVQSKPWLADYLPFYKDGINNRWDGPDSLSPIEKYALAFNLDPTKVTTDASILSQYESSPTRQVCRDDSSCASGEKCAKRRGQEEGSCVPIWFGSCHGWASASILEKEPKCPVTFNDVEFKVNDLKALMTALYAESMSGFEVVFTGTRCFVEGSIPVDEFGRYQVPSCRDMDPGQFHLVLTNVVGRLGKAFVMDWEARSPVWNEPILSYKILTTKSLSRKTALQSFWPDVSLPLTLNYLFNKDASKLVYVKTLVSLLPHVTSPHSFDAESTPTDDHVYEYILELDKKGRIV